MEEKKIFKNENFNQTSNRHAGVSRNFKNETEEHVTTKIPDITALLSKSVFDNHSDEGPTRMYRQVDFPQQ